MKAKKMALAIVGAALVTGLSAGAIALSNKNQSFFTRATVSTPHSIVLTASDFSKGDGDFWKAGVQFHYNAVSIESNVVTLGGNFFVTGASYSGKTKDDNNMRGNGFTSIAFADFAITSGAGDVVYLMNSARTIKDNVGVSENIDLTKSGSVDGEDRVAFEVNPGPSRSISFTSMSIGYECVESVPHVILSAGASSVGVGKTITVTATPKELFGETATYAWTSSDNDKATVVGDGTSATVTGVDVAAEVTITCKMTVAGTDYFGQINLEVVADVVIKPINFLNTNLTTNVQGAGVFLYIDNSGDIGFPTSGATADYNDKIKIDVEFKDNTGNYKGYEETIKSANVDNIRDCSSTQVTLYGIMAAGFPNGEDFTHKFTVTYTVSSTLKYVGSITFRGNTTVVTE